MKPVSNRESLSKIINLREKLDVFLVCDWHGSTHPAWPEQSRRLTPGQAIAEYEKCCQSTGSSWVVLKAVSRHGDVFDICTLRNAVNHTRAIRRHGRYAGAAQRHNRRLYG